MDFDFTDDQLSLRDAVQRWVDKGFGFERRHALAKAGGATRAVYAELAELGLTGLAVPEAHGGMGFGAVEAMVVMRRTGPRPGQRPLCHGALVAPALLAAPAACRPPGCRAWPSGSALVVLAHQERAARYRLNQVATRATQPAAATRWTAQERGAGRRRGRRLHRAGAHWPGADGDTPASACSWSSAAPVPVRGYPRRTAPAPPTSRWAGARATLITTDGLRCCSRRSTSASPRMRRGRGPDGPAGGHHRRVHEHAQAVRRGTIASFQALRHRIADVKMQLELGRSMSYFASLKLGEPAAQRRRACQPGAGAAGPVMRFVGQQCIQLHGGIGVTDEYVASHYFKRLTMLEMSLRRHACTTWARCRPHAGHGRRLRLRLASSGRPRGLPPRQPVPRVTDVAGLAVGHARGPPAHRLHRGAVPRRAWSAASTCAAARPARAKPTCCEREHRRPRARRAADRRQRLRAGCAGGVMRWLDERGPRPAGRPGARAHRAGGGAVRPVGRRRAHPPRRRHRLRRLPGRVARCRRPRAAPAPAPGATVGKLFGIERAMKGGIGSASLKVGAFTVARWWPSTPSATCSTPTAGARRRARAPTARAWARTMEPAVRRRRPDARDGRHGHHHRRGRHRRPR
jgi:alkylation response protein AidB-like acyl-CoA dehydrogenase